METIELVDRADGVIGSYCIRRMVNGTAYYWTPRVQCWVSAGYVFRDKALAEAIVKQLQFIENVNRFL